MPPLIESRKGAQRRKSELSGRAANEGEETDGQGQRGRAERKEERSRVKEREREKIIKKGSRA